MIAVLLNPLRRLYGSWMEVAEAVLRVRGGDLANLGGLEGILRSGSTHRGPPSKRRKPSRTYQASVEALFSQRYPFPLPKYQNSIRARMTKAKREKGSPELLEVIVEVEELVEDASPKEPVNIAGLKYLEFLARHARALYNGDKRIFGNVETYRTSLGRGTDALLEGRAIIARALTDPAAAPEYQRLKELDVWLFLNWVVAIGSYVKNDPEPNPAELAKTFAEHDAVGGFKKALEDLPHEWRVPYNGLDTASRFGPYSANLKMPVSDDDLALFYRKLLEFDTAFEDFDFTPGEVLSINQNPGFAYFRERFRTNPNAFAKKEKP